MRRDAPSTLKPRAPDLFAALEERELRYAVWKDLEDVDRFWCGDAELDILVHRADRVSFRRLAIAHGFAAYRHHVDVYGGELAHFIHFADGVHHHLHVHYALLTGDHRCLYLGGNTRSYSPLTRVANDIHRASLLASRLVPRSAFILDLSSILSAHLEYRKCRDRVRRIRSGQQAARRGVVVVFERYPIKHLFDYPRLVHQLEQGEIKIRPFAERIVRSRLAAIDKLLDHAGSADVTALIHTDYEHIAARRKLRIDEREDVATKLETWREFKRKSEHEIVIIENEGPAENAVARALELLNLRLCSFSS